MVLSSMEAEVGLRPPRTWPYIWVSNAFFLLHQWILDGGAVIAASEDLMNATSTYPTLGSSQILFPLSAPSSRHIFTRTVHPDVHTQSLHLINDYSLP